MTTHEVLVKARNLLARGTWVQYAAYGDDGKVCAMGAIGGVGDADADACRGALRSLTRVVGGEVPLDTWNDAPGRTKEEVLAAFDEAIAVTAPLPEDLDLSLPEHLDPDPIPFP